MGKKTTKADPPALPTIEELRRIAEMLATPIDFDQLVGDGVLKKRGAWWQILDWDRLPEHAVQKIQNIKDVGRSRVVSAYG